MVLQDVVGNEGVRWPLVWIQKYPILQTMVALILTNQPDQFGWLNDQGILYDFSILMGEKLKMQDKLKPWEMRDGISKLCTLCKPCPDNHSHMFFKCKFSALVWHKVQSMLVFALGSDDWSVMVNLIFPQASHNLARIVVSKLCFSATIYGIWQERNYCIFKKVHRTEKQVFEAIVSNTRLKLPTTRFKRSLNVSRVCSMWSLDSE
ncbi:uncharacterized protein [Rutidosis leptorrhynchoides]|uniref:uncharacterized protein n=1 Tax=Rutidosis leptorrhynchoides TaxID=125765 RepID=UPI003A99038B